MCEASQSSAPARIRTIMTLICVGVTAAGTSTSLALDGAQIDRPSPPYLINAVTLVDGVPSMFNPSATVANLDAGDLVAGNTLWDAGDGIIYLETRVGFLWSPIDGARPFEIPQDLYSNANRHIPEEIGASSTVVGWDLFTAQTAQLPFMWSPANGFVLLPLPDLRYGTGRPFDRQSTSWNGFAYAVSDDGRTIVGTTQQGLFGDAPHYATVWDVIPTSPQNSRIARDELTASGTYADAWDVSADGTVVVGDAGPSFDSVQAARWVNRLPAPMTPVGTSSTALFTAADGSASVGTGVVDGQEVLVRWDANGDALVAAPPAGLTVEVINAINPTATAVVGALNDNDPSQPFGNWAPFLWTMNDGFTVLPEFDRPQDFELSEALDVSDDGSLVVGWVRPDSSVNGDPPTIGFLWTATNGMIAINDLLQASGISDPSVIYRVSAVSGDGSRLLGTGNPSSTSADTNSVILQLTPN